MPVPDVFSLPHSIGELNGVRVQYFGSLTEFHGASFDAYGPYNGRYELVPVGEDNPTGGRHLFGVRRESFQRR